MAISYSSVYCFFIIKYKILNDYVPFVFTVTVITEKTFDIEESNALKLDRTRKVGYLLSGVF